MRCGRLLAIRDNAPATLRAEAVRALQAGVRQIDVVHKTGWTREYLPRLKQRAEGEPKLPAGTT